MKKYIAPQTEIVKLEGTAVLMYTVNTGSGGGNGEYIPQ